VSDILNIEGDPCNSSTDIFELYMILFILDILEDITSKSICEGRSSTLPGLSNKERLALKLIYDALKSLLR
jgi:hypothetical protein